MSLDLTPSSADVKCLFCSRRAKWTEAVTHAAVCGKSHAQRAKRQYYANLNKTEDTARTQADATTPASRPRPNTFRGISID